MTANWLSITAITRGTKDSADWSARPDPGGPWKNASAPGKTRPGWITTRSGSITHGTGTSPCRCSPWHSSPLSAAPLKRGPAACGQSPPTDRTNTPDRHEQDQPPDPQPGPGHRRLTPLTTAEIRRLFHLPRHDNQALDHGLYWSAWRRQHQGEARWHHFRRR